MKVVSRVTAFLCLFFCLFTPLTFAEDDVVITPGTVQDATMNQEPIEPEPSLPAKYDLRNVDGRSYVTPVKCIPQSIDFVIEHITYYNYEVF